MKHVESRIKHWMKVLNNTALDDPRHDIAQQKLGALTAAKASRS